MNASFAAVENLAGLMKRTGIQGDDSSITAEEFELRKRFARFTAEDAALLSELRDTFTEHADEVVEAFYAHLLRFPPPAELLEDPERVRRVKLAQREYLISMTQGSYGVEYAHGRLAIGRVHDGIGLDPEWYLGAYGLYLDLLSPLIRQRFASEPSKVAPALAALGKLIVLDMQLVQDAYYGLQRKRAVEQSEHLAAVGQLAASIAHEVRNPLAGMKGALEVLRKELAVKPSNLEIVDELLAQIGRLEHLVRDLLDYARPQALSPQPFDLHEMLDRLIRMVKEQSDARGITVERVDGPGTSRLIADPKQIEQVVLNLIHNAIQAMDGGGTLRVATRVRGGAMVIIFKDTGKGIPPTELRRIFQPFYTTKHRGSGLGLPIVMKIAEAHAGSIQINSEPGKGTTATLRLPRGDSEAEAIAAGSDG
jgi:signal transduction histidine kinase